MWRRVLLLPLILTSLGCPHRAPAPAQAEDWYVKPNLFSSFDAEAADLSLPSAYLLELACYIGDRGTFEVDKTLATWGFGRRRDFRDLRTSTYGYVASDERMVLVTFGGTDFLNVRDLLSDVDALQLVFDERYCATPEARVHRGFRDSLNSVMDGVVDEVRSQAAAAPTAGRSRATKTQAAREGARAERVAVRRAGESATTQSATRPSTRATSGPTTRPAARADSRGASPPRKKLFVAGHSRGGAFAVLAAAALAKAREQDESIPQIGGVYTFGQPRVGNGPFVEATAAQGVPLWRFVNRDDPIPDVPPAGVVSQRIGAERLGDRHGYQHGGVAVHLRADGRVVKLPPGGTGGAASLTDPRAATAAIGNHYQAGYHTALYAALANPEAVEEPAWRATAAGGRVGALPSPPR